MKRNPLAHGYSRETIAENIRREVACGTPQAQAIAIAYSVARRAWRMRHRSGKMPVHLQQELLTPRAKSGKSPRMNPVPLTRKVQLREAARLYEDFSGHEAEVVAKLPKPEMPDVLIAVGDIDGILYTTVRDGKVEKYIHEFNRNSRPLFCVSFDGKSLYMLGGAYDFTERGIVDRR